MFKYINNIIIKILNLILIKSNLKSKIIDYIKLQNGLKTLSVQELNYENIQSLEDVECKIYSQNGEDGIVNFLTKKLNLKNPSFVEIGVGDYSEANTRLIYDRFHTKGIIFDMIENFENRVKKNINFWKGDIKAIQANINSNNFEKLLSENCEFDIDIFSIDIDGIDYWIIKKLKNKISKIFIAEYNSNFGSDLEITVPDIKDFNRTKYHYSNLCYGMSLKLLIKLMKQKGYYFLGTNILKNNAFFINKDYKKDLYFPNVLIRSLDQYTNSNIRESRDKSNNLNFYSDKNKLETIKNCMVVDLSDDENFNEKKIKELMD